MRRIQPGDNVIVTDANGEEHHMVALSAVEGTHRNGRKIHDFPVIRVRRPLASGGSDRIPWPADAVRLEDGQ